MPLRAVRSFVRRAGRMTEAQQRALQELWPRFGVPSGDGRLELAALFGRVAPCTLEIGFGNGEHLAARALAEPLRDFLGVEVHRPGIGQLLRAAAAAGLANLRIIEQDAVEVLRTRIPAEALDEVQLLFPDPWPKQRHHKRRLVQPEFALLVADRLRRGGRLHLATDWAPYAQHMQLVLDACPSLAPPAGRAGATGAARAATRFERRGLRLGHAVRDLVYERRG
ncbi:MAG: tRNA (guanosine(46)-N7)-methyltransferase TrmB [Gammaproteobacteria bacterium]|nr:tRNA (guanosine(46)-N7)-methyltransferase TrmB [Gammaproteobacteria bacterium]MDE2250800.1 tRNA (guanosine(46)-N7)-methyltransferase TrmB [Gammaproteobacteria bacterium]